MGNKFEQRQRRILEILTLLNEGGTFEEAKRLFSEEFDGVDVSDIAAAEKSLIQQGLHPSEIQKLCNIHAAVFNGSVSDIHVSNYEHEQLGHPVNVFKLENQVLESLLTDEIDGLLEKINTGDYSRKDSLEAAIADLAQIKKHYVRKEMLLMPVLEKYGVAAPFKTMVPADKAVLDDILKLISSLEAEKINNQELLEKWQFLKEKIFAITHKEEKVLIPVALEIFNLEDWKIIAEESYTTGYAYIPAPPQWKPGKRAVEIENENEPLRLIALQKVLDSLDEIADKMVS
ncbi:DUF438 domain-containing protein [Vagococcus elongatus]|uniref:DUF438 domain-containing protein n=1 Tax=Vagococcus elongatus TaxID=180344 RepID=A0A430B4G4_9ENTE|nr:DUF438 domain-containing protein [Vagococcus elongatus]RSU15227.1 hypothetical protein CBF29_02520 [Vagococcus elongatus]